METEQEKNLNLEIIRLTMEIRNNYPELEKYLEEVPLGIPNNQRMTLQTLIDYRDTLKALIQNHNPDKRKETRKVHH